MKRAELYFRQIVTRLGTIPGIFLVIAIICYIANFQLHTMVLLCVAIGSSYAIGTVIKYLYYKPRPIPQGHKTWREKIDASSFPSMHTANSLICAFFGAMVTIMFGGLHNGIRGMISLVSRFLLFVVVSLSRIALQKHYAIDVLAGTIFGILIIVGVLMLESQIMEIVNLVF